MSIKENVLYYDFTYISYTLPFYFIVLAGYMFFFFKGNSSTHCPITAEVRFAVRNGCQ